MYIELSRNTPLLVQLFFINDQDDKSDIDGAKGNETLLNWINEEIQSLKEEQFFHKDYDETLVAKMCIRDSSRGVYKEKLGNAASLWM